MKKSILLLITCLLVTVTLCYGQKNKSSFVQNDIYYMQNSQTRFSKSILNDSISISIIQKIKGHKELTAADDIYYIKNCLGRYYKIRQTGTVLGIVSAISAGAYLVGEAENKELLVISGATGFLSYITYLTAEKWLKRASLKPADSGFGIKFEF